MFRRPFASFPPEELYGAFYNRFTGESEECLGEGIGGKPEIIHSAERALQELEQREREESDERQRAKVRECKELLRTEIERQVFLYVAVMQSRLQPAHRDRWNPVHDGDREAVGNIVLEYEARYLGKPIPMAPPSRKEKDAA